MNRGPLQRVSRRGGSFQPREQSRGNPLNSFCLLYPVLFMSFMFSSCKYPHPFVFPFDLHPLYIVNNHIFSTSLVNITIFFSSLTLVNLPKCLVYIVIVFLFSKDK